MDLDPLLLSRLQFAFTISFHILFPAFTIGLAWWIVMLEGVWLWTNRPIFRSLSEFWTKIFAISFGMGVVSGIVMSYQFGTNWSRWSDVTGNVLGPLIQYEVVTAFFLEAAFLGIMLFGRDRVPRPIHFLATFLVALGTLISAFWILSANSWMHTPAGYEIRDGRFFVTDWWQVVFNPSFPYRLAHMLTATFLTASFVVAGFSAWYMLREHHLEHARQGMAWSLGLITVLAPLQVVIGDLHGLNTLDHQPAKIAAMEGHWEGGPQAPLILFGIPDMEQERNHYEIGIPGLSSLILTHEFEGEVPGLKQFPREDRPNAAIVFFSFRVMVGLGLLMVLVAVLHVILRLRGTLFENRAFMRFLIAMTPSGFVALEMGWITTEAGRQPWVVQGLMRTADAVTPSLTGPAAATTLAAFVAAYAIIYLAGSYYLVRMLRTGPNPPSHYMQPHEPARDAPRPKRPLSKADQAFAEGE